MFRLILKKKKLSYDVAELMIKLIPIINKGIIPKTK